MVEVALRPGGAAAAGRITHGGREAVATERGGEPVKRSDCRIRGNPARPAG